MIETTDLEEARRVLCERLRRYLDGLEPALREDVGAALALEGKLLHRPARELDGRWALLPFCLAQDLRAPVEAGGLWVDAACDVALAMECVVSATDLLDDVMDDDTTPLIARIGMARALNVALALISLSQCILLALLDLALPVTVPARLMDMMQRAILQASTGQQQDLLAERRPACDLTRDECLAIAAAKAGALLSLACQMGALCARIGEAGIERCAEVGRLLGIAAQLEQKDTADCTGSSLAARCLCPGGARNRLPAHRCAGECRTRDISHCPAGRHYHYLGCGSPVSRARQGVFMCTCRRTNSLTGSVQGVGIRACTYRKPGREEDR